jgi:hypothetical protein
VAVASMLACALTDDTPRSGDSGSTGALAALANFRAEWFACLTGRGEELFELTDAVLCADGPVKTLVGLVLAPEHRRGHGALYDGLNHGRLNIARVRRAWPRCRCRGPPTGGSFWRSTSHPGCAPTRSPRRGGRSATPTAGARTSTG